jgi:hypothetical protein
LGGDKHKKTGFPSRVEMQFSGSLKYFFQRNVLLKKKTERQSIDEKTMNENIQD